MGSEMCIRDRNKIRESAVLQDEQLPSLESAITAFFENQPTGQANPTRAPTRTTARPPQRLVSEPFVRRVVREEVQQSVDDGCRQCKARVDDYIGSPAFLDTLQHAFASALPDWLLCDDTLSRIATAVFQSPLSEKKISPIVDDCVKKAVQSIETHVSDERVLFEDVELSSDGSHGLPSATDLGLVGL